MKTEKEIRGELEERCQARGKQAEIARLLDVSQSTVKRWLDGGEIPPVMRKVLAWILFGEAPARLNTDIDAQTVLEFEPDEWRVIEAMARRAGTTPALFIRDRIRDHLFMLEQLAKPQPPTLKVAEDPVPYQSPPRENGGKS